MRSGAKSFRKFDNSLLFELTLAKFKIIDHNSFLGILWSLIAPVMMFFAMYFIFKTSFGQKIYAYPLFLLTGIVCVNFFATATTYTLKIFFSNREIVINSTIPREMLILSDMFIHAYKFVIELLLCMILSALYGLFSWKSVFLILPLIAAYIAYTIGIGLILSLIYCFSNDIEHIWMMVSRLLFFITPVFYTLDRISPLAQKIVYWANPLTPFLISFRHIIMGGDGSIFTYVYSLLLGVFIIIGGWCVFALLENAGVERV